MKDVIRLENWALVFLPCSPYSAPETLTSGLCGLAYGDSRREDGHEVTTSRLIGRKGEVFYTKSGSQYVLGSIDPGYEEVCPDAYNRLLKSVLEIDVQ